MKNNNSEGCTIQQVKDAFSHWWFVIFRRSLSTVLQKEDNDLIRLFVINNQNSVYSNYDGLYMAQATILPVATLACIL